jgi:protein-S-isoprenylcysteine O-methyltransferase Ste14
VASRVVDPAAMASRTLGGLEAGGHRVVHGGARFSGPVPHPQYDGFILIMVGFLLQWPTLLTLVMFPILVMMYVRLARREDREVREAFGEEYARYAATTPAFFPRPGFVRPNRA